MLPPYATILLACFVSVEVKTDFYEIWKLRSQKIVSRTYFHRYYLRVTTTLRET
jgi:hypothetical protein